MIRDMMTGFTADERNVIRGTNKDDYLVGTDGNDVIKPGLGADTIDGAAGYDIVDFSFHSEQGNDWGFTLNVAFDGSSLSGNVYDPSRSNISTYTNIEKLNFVGTDVSETITVNSPIGLPQGSLHVDGGGGYNALNLAAPQHGAMMLKVDGDGSIESNQGDFVNFQSFYIEGSPRDDVIETSYGRDIIEGGRGGDTLLGGAGANYFVYSSYKDSLPTDPDHILDFIQDNRDEIGLNFDGDTALKGFQQLDFIGSNPFDEQRGELRYTDNHDGTYLVEADIDRDGVSDFALVVTSATAPVADDFDFQNELPVSGARPWPLVAGADLEAQHVSLVAVDTHLPGHFAIA